ncbi:AraC family transcriptional regulator [Cohnella mopanensis]|uniref:AraC family transcriptional regulator n=1 Tax=Cohnella mopanensis TaxID=2911966 RepID=UPI001EF8C2C1|nr:helix-turn-helix domain-containing protein [Cohnella mopanensis]
MNTSELDDYLRNWNEIERIALASPMDIYSAYEETLPKVNGISTILEFLHPGEHLSFSKHPRHVAVPEHRHDFLEMIFVYSGECRQTINGEQVLLASGEFCIMDTNVVHSVEKPGDNDIVINFLMSKRYFDIDLIKRLSGNDLMSEFLVNSIYRSQENNTYIVFRSSTNRKSRSYMEQALCEFFDRTLGSEEAINCHIILLFTELMREYQQSDAFRRQGSASKSPLTKIIQYINDHYKELTLDSLANHFNFHPNYLSGLLKTHLGYGFTKMVQDLKIKEATMLLKYSNMPIGDIAYETGYSNITVFYKHFKERHVVTPSEYRRFYRHQA